MSVIWRKVWRDLAHNRARTALVVLSIAAGVFALGLVLGTSGLVDTSLAREDEISRPAHLIFRGEQLDQETVEAALREPGVADAELEMVAIVRWRLPEGAEWRHGVLVAREDYRAQRVSLVELVEGDWPGRNTLMVELQTLRSFDIPLGASIIVESGTGEMVSVDGVVRKAYVPPPTPDKPAVFYVTPETLTRLTGVRDASKLHVRLSSDGMDAENVRKRVEDRLGRMGLTVTGFTSVGVEDGIPVDYTGDVLDAMFLVLGVLGVVLLGLSGFLIVNTMNAILVQQTWQIGVMKVLGATFWRVARVYLLMALVYGLLALVLAIPLGVLGANALAGLLLEMLSIVTPAAFQISPTAVAVQVVMAVVVSLLAAALPVVAGVRISPHRAIGTYGLGERFGRGPLDRLMGRLRFLPRPVALSLRNVFRRKVRVALTLSTFALVGVLFIAVVSARSSFRHSVELLLEGFAYDVMVHSPRHYRADRLAEVTAGVPGVASVEVWEQGCVNLSLATGEYDILVYGIPPGSEAFQLPIFAGRKLLPGDGHAILLDNRLAMSEGIGVGDEVTLTIAGQESTWTVVGLLSLTAAAGPEMTNFVPFDALTGEVGRAGRGNMAIVISEVHDVPAREQLIADLSDAYAAQHIEARNLNSADDLRQTLNMAFDTLAYLLGAMAFLAAVVGCMGLLGTLSINVVERMREVGVMRATGAVSSDVFAVFLGEGVSLGVLSWLLAMPLSYPCARAFGNAIGLTFGAPLDFDYSLPSIFIWLILVTVLSALASLWPAWRATRVSVREALAYE
ncbi:MAG: ABC transporter permease [Anaerolineae bacterium]|nr:ABC transporter permease [Anaerolineae bacterium]